MSVRARSRSEPELTFSDRELIDLAVAWLTLSVAFSLIFAPVHAGADVGYFLGMVGLSLVTVGVAFLLHELAHKVVAIEHGQIAEFRADYQMLFLALMGALVGFLFAAPGAVYHRGRITQRENAMIALAGPVTNHLLAIMFLPLVLMPAPLGTIGQMGVWINLVLAAFNMIPFGPLDGKSVYDWHKGVFALVFVPSALLAGYVVLFANPF
ncbi:metalloprotease [Haloterrigena sp. SYSU A558-1]|uniref:Metalloprotease n=1 Tax=Haloterrigena gelatinilytica TaxID=2741724 RepID=A0A8J8GQW3_9EURY|nr:metalloprotease [Haloterrigena gelatinilytica]NUB91895.1 metalloprotease [Haloterrigena gelatinilytica]NUC72280.1 metalloprotease [Haloterrigena gelatinilytica]